MNTITTILLCIFVAASAQYTGNPVTLRDATSVTQRAFVALNNKLYAFNLPGLSVSRTYTADPSVVFASPAAVNGKTLTFSDAKVAGVYNVDSTTFTFSYDASGTRPEYSSPAPDTLTDAQGNTYRFDFSGVQTVLTKTRTISSAPATILTLSKKYTAKGLFQLENGILYFTVAAFSGRGSTDYDYYAVNSQDLSILDGPVQLPNSAASGCPTSARDCGVPVTQYISVVEGLVLYVYTEKLPQEQNFRVTVNTYTKSCGFSANSFTDTTDPDFIGNNKCPSELDCGNLRRCGGLCINPARQYCCNNNETGFFYIDGQPNPNATCQFDTPASSTVPSTPATSSPTLDCGQLARCGDLCYNPARVFCCNNNETGFYFIDGQPNPRATCQDNSATSTVPATMPSTSIDCNGFPRCGDLCYNPARIFCCNNNETGFYFIDGQPNPRASCQNLPDTAMPVTVTPTTPLISLTLPLPSTTSALNSQSMPLADTASTVNAPADTVNRQQGGGSTMAISLVVIVATVLLF